MTDYDVIIVGGGLVGSALAAQLASGDAETLPSVAVIEASDKLGHFTGDQYDPRVSALTMASQGLLRNVGAWPAIEAERVSPYRHMHVWDAEGTGSIEFDCAEVYQPALGHIVENSVTIRALRAQLADKANIDWLCPVKVESIERPEQLGDTVTVHLDDGRALQAQLLVAADGALSRVRQWSGFRTREWDYGHKAIVTTVRTEKPHQQTAWQRFLSEGPLAFLPLSDPHSCSIVWSAEEVYADNLMALDDEMFADALGRQFEHRLGAIEAVDKRFSFPLRQRHAVDYFCPGVALIGDAAHTIHPLAGQGVNLGFGDAEVLGEELLRAKQAGIPLGDGSVLRRYQRRRQGNNLMMMGVMEGFKRLFGQTSLPVRWLRNEGLRQVDRLQPLKRQIMRQAMGL